MKKKLFAAGAFALVLAACSSGIDTNADWDPTANFNAYQTYAWVEGAYTTGLGDLADTRLQAAVEAKLNAKGPWPGGYYGGYGYGGWGGGSSIIYATTYTEGSLVIGLFDLESKSMVWQGVGTKTLSESNDSPEERAQKINEAVAKIMEAYPPGS